jgi:N-methylhydantoinase B
VKLFKKGVLDQEILAILNSNMRIAEQRIGDIRAQAAALKVGERRLAELIARYGTATVTEAIGEIRQRASKLMRAYIRDIPDGTYRSEAFVDSDGVVNQPLKIALAVTKAGETLDFDFTGSSPPCRGPMNSVVATTYSISPCATSSPTRRSTAARSSPCASSAPRARFSMRAIPAPCRAAPPKSRSALPRPSSWRWCRRFPSR